MDMEQEIMCTPNVCMMTLTLATKKIQSVRDPKSVRSGIVLTKKLLKTELKP